MQYSEPRLNLHLRLPFHLDMLTLEGVQGYSDRQNGLSKHLVVALLNNTAKDVSLRFRIALNVEEMERYVSPSFSTRTTGARTRRRNRQMTRRAKPTPSRTTWSRPYPSALTIQKYTTEASNPAFRDFSAVASRSSTSTPICPTTYFSFRSYFGPSRPSLSSIQIMPTASKSCNASGMSFQSLRSRGAHCCFAQERFGQAR